MKKFNLKKMVAYVLVAMLTLGVFSMNVAAAEVEEPTFKDALEAAEDAGIRLDEATRDQLEAIVKEAADSLDIVEEGVESEKSTFVSFAEHPVKVVEEDGEGHGLRGVAVKTIALTYVADTENLYVGITEDGTIYRSFEEPSEPGFYYAVCMYAGDDNNYPSVGYGIVVILPAEEKTTEEGTDTTETTEPEATEPEATEPEATEPEATEPEATEPEATEAPATDATTSEEEAPKTGDESNIMAYAAATVVALCGMAVIVMKKRNA